MVKVDYDTLTGQLRDAGLIDGTPIHIDEIRHIACDAEFIQKKRPWPQAQAGRGVASRLGLGGTVRRAASETGPAGPPVHREAPHRWHKSRPTDITNLVLLCPKCHKKVHKEGHTVSRTSAGLHQLRPPPNSRSPD